MEITEIKQDNTFMESLKIINDNFSNLKNGLGEANTIKVEAALPSSPKAGTSVYIQDDGSNIYGLFVYTGTDWVQVMTSTNSPADLSTKGYDRATCNTPYFSNIHTTVTYAKIVRADSIEIGGVKIWAE